MNQDLKVEIERAHKDACTRVQDTYKDPATGADVFTEIFLLKQGYCCENNCRHCPYEANENK
ncbi:MAG TPA: hypothetical protein HA224_00945 [Nanoarchaeota archaeon]|nr:hypothetical protein [Nanoarchaeota archaeon]